MIIFIDNYDSFVYNLVDYFLITGEEVVVFRNDEIHENDKVFQSAKGIVLSPGPGRPQQAGRMMNIIDKHYKNLPIFGVCLGHQALGEFFGASLVCASQPVHGKAFEMKLSDHPLFEGIPSVSSAMRYHSLMLDHPLPEGLFEIARTHKGECMGIAHLHFPLWGVQFHPESILTAHGKTMIRNVARWMNEFEASSNQKKNN
jgi:anthranilate synthase/aminodeoxychorismate synthase-like glutamine amidotransferase